jgi:Ca2+:H+ antiporter
MPRWQRSRLIITIFAIREAAGPGGIHHWLVIGNILLVMGASILVGGLKNGVQRFNRADASVNATQLLLAVLALAVPSLFFFAHTETYGPVESLSLGTAAAMLLIYALGLIFVFRHTETEAVEAHKLEEGHAPVWSVKRALAVLLAATVLVALLSEILVGSVDHAAESLGLSEFFIGIIVVPLW